MWINFRIDAPIGDGNITFGEIKRWIEQTYRIPARFQHLQYAPDGLNFELLNDDVTVNAYGLDNDDRLYMALAPLPVESSCASNRSVNFEGHANDAGAQHPPQEPQLVAGINASNINNADHGMFDLNEQLVAEDNAYIYNFDVGVPLLLPGDQLSNPGMINNDPPLTNPQNYLPTNVIFNFVPNPPLLVAGALNNLAASVGNDPPIMNRQILDLNAAPDMDMDDNVNYGPLAEIFQLIQDPSLPIDHLGGKQLEQELQDLVANQQNPNTDELDDYWHLSMNPTIGDWDKSDAQPQAAMEQYLQPSGNFFFFGFSEGDFAQHQPPWWQNWPAEGSIGQVGEAGPSNTAARDGSVKYVNQ